MNMLQENSVLRIFGIGIISILAKSSHQSECGTKLENGTVMCNLISQGTTVKSFEFNLCTHATIYLPVACANETCSFQTTLEIEMTLKWAQPIQPNMGVQFSFDQTLLFLNNNTLRHSNSAKEFANFMKDRRLTFVYFLSSPSAFSDETNKSNFLMFIEKLAEELHGRGLHIGLGLQGRGSELRITEALGMLSKIVDWFTVTAHKSTSYGYMQPLTPLTLYDGDDTESTKYWIEHALRWIHPQCLLLDVGPRAQTHTATDKAVEPGLRSKAQLTKATHFNISDICYKVYVDSDCREYWDEESNTPWAVCGDVFYTYDNAKSLRMKVDLARHYNITRLLFSAEDLGPDNICDDGDPLTFLRAVQRIREKTV